MKRNIGKEELEASDSSPVDTKQKDDGTIRNQTTNVPKNRFPWAIIIVIAVILVMVGFLLSI